MRWFDNSVGLGSLECGTRHGRPQDIKNKVRHGRQVRPQVWCKAHRVSLEGRCRLRGMRGLRVLTGWSTVVVCKAKGAWAGGRG